MGEPRVALEPLVVLDDAGRLYGQIIALNNVSFAIDRGEMFGLIGPDGAGKTTTIRLIAGLLAASTGRVRVFERDPRRDHRAITARVGYLSQRFSLYGDLSIDENIEFFAEIHGVRDFKDRRDRLLDLTQLTPFRTRLADHLSGGMKQKLALACTLVHQPDVILLDEPTTGVDPVSRREFWKLLSEFLHEGLTIVMATPYLDEAERCSRVAMLHEGRLLALDRPAALRAAFPGEVLEVVATPFDRAQTVLTGHPDVDALHTFGERFHVRFHTLRGEPAESHVTNALIAAGCDAAHVRRIVPSLEDVFIDLIGRTAPTPATAPARPS